MQLIDIPTEQTTAATDVVLSLIATMLTIIIYRKGKGIDLTKTRIWSWIFGLLVLASFLGAIAHGLKMSELINYILWQPLNLALGISVGLFVAGVLYDWLGFKLPGFVIPVLIGIAIVFYIITLILPGGFSIFIIYEAIAMIIAIVIYLILFFRRRLKGAGLMSAGILITILAAIIQTIDSIKINLFWEFDNNGIFHIVQIFGLVILTFGLLKELNSRSGYNHN